MVEEIFKEFIEVINLEDGIEIDLVIDEKVVLSSAQSDKYSKTEDYLSYQLQTEQHDKIALRVYGNSQNLNMIGSIIYTSLQTRIDFENTNRSLKQNVTADDTLIKLILSKKRWDTNQMVKLSQSLEFDLNMPKVCVVLHTCEKLNQDMIIGLKMLKQLKKCIVSLQNYRNLIIYKHLESPLTDYHQEVKAMIESIFTWGIKIQQAYVSGLGYSIKQFVVLFEQCQWLAQTWSKGMEDVCFFEDHLNEYILHIVNKHADLCVLPTDIYGESMRSLEEIITIAQCLYRHDFNYTKAAAELFLHKNTLLYKIAKIEEKLFINIRGSFDGKMKLLIYSALLNDKLLALKAGYLHE